MGGAAWESQRKGRANPGAGEPPYCWQMEGQQQTPRGSSRPARLPGSGLSPQIRLSGGRSRFEGRVEVAMVARGNRARQWGLICGEGWGTLEAMVACRQLGLGYANHGLQVGHYC